MTKIATWITRLSLIVALFAGFTNASAQQLSAFLDSNAIVIGNNSMLYVNLSCSATDTVEWFTVPDTLHELIEIVKVGPLDTSYAQEDITIKQLTQGFLITSFDSGYHAIAPFTVTINGNPYASEPLLLEVNTVPVDTSKGIADIFQPKEVPFSFVEWIKENQVILLSSLAILAIIIIIVYQVLRARKRLANQKPVEVVEPTRPAHEIAFEKLEKLKQAQVWQSGEFKQYYTELTEITREYMEARFGFSAMEATTSEIKIRLKPYVRSKEIIELIISMLSDADLVKFAKVIPVGSEAEQAWDLAHKFVSKTKKKKEVDGAN